MNTWKGVRIDALESLRWSGYSSSCSLMNNDGKRQNGRGNRGRRIELEDECEAEGVDGDTA